MNRCWSPRCPGGIYRGNFCAIHWLRYVVAGHPLPWNRRLPGRPLQELIRCMEHEGTSQKMIARRLSTRTGLSERSWRRTINRIANGQATVNSRTADQLVVVGCNLPTASVLGSYWEGRR